MGIGQPDVVHESSDELHQPNRISRSGRSRSTTPPASRPMTPPGEPQVPLLLPVPDTPQSATGSFASEVEELTAQRLSIKFEADRLEWHENRLRRLARGQSDVELKDLRLKCDNLRAENVVLKAELQKIKSAVASHERLQVGQSGKSERDHASKTEEDNSFACRLELLLNEKQQLAQQCEDVQAENDSLKQTVGQLLPKCVVLEVELQLLLRKHSGYRRDNGGTAHDSKTMTPVPETHAALPAGGGCQEQLQLQQQQQWAAAAAETSSHRPEAGRGRRQAVIGKQQVAAAAIAPAAAAVEHGQEAAICRKR